MIEINIGWRPQEIADKVRYWSFETIRNVDHTINSIGWLIANYAKKNIQKGGRTGRTYRRRSISHQASAPYEWPKSDTGRLVSSIRSDSIGFLTAAVGSDLIYSEYLENGTPGGRMQPRPWLARSFADNEKKIDAMLLAAIKDTFK